MIIQFQPIFFSGNITVCINCYEKETKTITYQKQEYCIHDNTSWFQTVDIPVATEETDYQYLYTSLKPGKTKVLQRLFKRGRFTSIASKLDIIPCMLNLEQIQLRCQGLLSGGKMRDPGNEVGPNLLKNTCGIWRFF